MAAPERLLCVQTVFLNQLGGNFPDRKELSKNQSKADI
jgi:hypothetical protein